MIVSVGLTPVEVGNGRSRVVAHPQRAVLMRAVARHLIDIDPPDLGRSRGLQNLRVAVDDPAALGEVVRVRRVRDAGDW
jgi:hypothetical protein